MGATSMRRWSAILLAEMTSCATSHRRRVRCRNPRLQRRMAKPCARRELNEVSSTFSLTKLAVMGVSMISPDGRAISPHPGSWRICCFEPRRRVRHDVNRIDVAAGTIVSSMVLNILREHVRDLTRFR